MRASVLVGRDPALAALVGVMGTANADFGMEYGDFGDEFDDDDFGMDDDDDDDDFGDDSFGEFAGSKKRRRRGRGGSLALAKRALAFKRVQHRRALINPNADSSLKVERYTFTLNQAIVLGTPLAAFATMTGNPDVTFRPQRLTFNAPSPMFAFVQVIRMANVNVTVGTGLEDAFDYNANGVGQMLDMPTLSPANRATILGNYTGFTPPGYVVGTATTLTASFKGPATLAPQ